MHATGIKDVFWTDNEREWEGAKVQHLMDALADPRTSSARVNAGGDARAFFVTKHEVLMLRRGTG